MERTLSPLAEIGSKLGVAELVAHVGGGEIGLLVDTRGSKRMSRAVQGREIHKNTEDRSSPGSGTRRSCSGEGLREQDQQRRGSTYEIERKSASRTGRRRRPQGTPARTWHR